MRYRQGTVGAILDEYEKVVNELVEVVMGLSQDEFVQIRDAHTPDPDCRSIESVMQHVIRSGYGYIYYIEKAFHPENTERQNLPAPTTVHEAITELHQMFAFNEQQLLRYQNITEQEVIANRFDVPWGQNYDFEQILEHAIVHVLRHRRQIEKFMAAG